MKFAVVELKYMARKYFIVNLEWIKNLKKKITESKDVFCFISTDLSEEPDFGAKYFTTFEGVSGMFKVFVTKITNTYEDAISFLKNSRLQTVPKKLRVPTNTDSELNAEEKKRKRTENRTQKINKEIATIKNTSHLATLVKRQSEKATNENKIVSTQETLNVVEGPSSSAAIQTDKSTAFHLSSSANKNQNHSIIVTPNENGKNALLVGEAIKRFNKNAVPKTAKQSQINVATASASSEDSRANKNQYQPIIVNPKKKRKIELLVGDVENSVQANAVPKNGSSSEINVATVFDEEKVFLPPSSSGNNKNQNQSIVILSNKKIKNSLPVSEADKSQAVLLCSTGQNKKEQNSFSESVAKPLQNKVVASCTANFSVVSVSFKVPDCVRYPPSITGNKPLAIVSNDVESVESNSKKRNVVTDAKTNNVLQMKAIIKNLQEENAQLQKKNAQLKEDNKNATERNTALQIALVTCTKAMPQPLEFENKDGGRLYKCGIFLNETQCTILDAIDDHREYVNNLILAVFGSDVLKKSSVKGKVSNRTKAPAKPALNSNGLNFIYDFMAVRTRNSVLYTRYKINAIINKKIYNLLAADDPKPRPKQVKKTKVDPILVDEEDTDHINENEQFGIEEYDEKEVNEEYEELEPDKGGDDDDEGSEVEDDEQLEEYDEEEECEENDEEEEYEEEKECEEGNEDENNDEPHVETTEDKNNELGEGQYKEQEIIASDENDISSINLDQFIPPESNYYIMDLPVLNDIYNFNL